MTNKTESPLLTNSDIFPSGRRPNLLDLLLSSSAICALTLAPVVVAMGVSLTSTTPVRAQALYLGSTSGGVVLDSYPGWQNFVVQNTTAITGPGNAISGSNASVWQLVNAGTISGGTNGVRLEGAGLIVNGVASTYTASLISGAERGVQGVSAPLTIVNYATITGGTAIELGAGGTVTNSGTAASIYGTDTGIRVIGGNLIVTNDGTISGGTVGVVLDSAAGNLTISGTGTISGDTGVLSQSTTSLISIQAGSVIAGNTHGVSMAGGTLTNAGSITAANSDAVHLLGSATITNGSTANTSALIRTSFGRGIQADAANNSSVLVTNFGTIDGASDGVHIDGTISAGGSITSNGTVINHAGATISGGSVGVIGYYANLTLTNDGTIVSTSGDGVYVAGGGSLTNTGTISGAGNGVRYAYQHGQSATIDNSGRITGGSGFGVDLEQGAIINRAGGYLGADSGVQLNNGTLLNSGSIVGTGIAGVRSLSDNVIVNYASGRIAGATVGIYMTAGGTLSNDGTISSTGGIGVYSTAAGTITNGGTANANARIEASSRGISGTTGALVISNFGTITGNQGIYLTAGGTLTNSGTASFIEGTGSVAAYALNSDLHVINEGMITSASGQGVGVWNGGGSLTNTNTGTISGGGDAVTFGYTNGAEVTIDNAGRITSTGGYGVNLDRGTIVNQTGGYISGLHGAQLGTGTLENSGTIIGTSDWGVRSNGSGNHVSNLAGGTISGVTHGVFMVGSTLSNTGLIEATGTAGIGVYSAGTDTITNVGTAAQIIGAETGVKLTFAGSLLRNEGIIKGSTLHGVYQSTNGAIINFGTASLISGYTAGILVTAAGSSTAMAVSIANAGRIEALGTSGVGIWTQDGLGTIVNSGSILGGSGGFGIQMSDGGSVRNTDTASLISGGVTGIYVQGAAGTITNYGTIRADSGVGVWLSAGGSVSNLGSTSRIIGDLIGVQLDGTTASITNEGTIVGMLGSGVQLADGGTVVNTLSGVIEGDCNGIGSGLGTLLVNNSGHISGACSASAGVYAVYGATVNNIGAGSQITGLRYGVYVGYGTGIVTNEGAIRATGTNGVGVWMNGGGTVSNIGSASLISGLRGGVRIEGASGSVSNGGTITSTGTSGIGVELVDGGTITNALGALIEGHCSAVSADGLLVVDNSGRISGTCTTSAGVNAGAGGTINNLGIGSQITGAWYGVRVAGGAGTVLNEGTISASGQSGSFTAGVSLFDGGSITNSGTASRITGLARGIMVYGSSGTVINEGVIAGTYYNGGINPSSTEVFGIDLRRGGSFTNTGSAALIYGYTGIVGRDDGSTGARTSVTNSGTILGIRRAGVRLDAGGFVYNTIASALISGAEYGILSSGGSATVTNAGTIISTGSVASNIAIQFGGTSNNTVINAGSIISNGGTAIAFGSGNDLLAITPESVIVGIISGGGGTDTLMLAAGTLSNTGTLARDVADFALVNVQAGANWLISNSATLSGGVGISTAGRLTNAGSINGSVTLTGAGALTNQAGARITSYNSSAVTGLAGATGTLTNAGILRGSSTFAGASIAGANTVFNSGGASAIYGYGSGVAFTGTGTNAGTLINDGRIVGFIGTGVSAVDASVTNRAGAVIAGQYYGVAISGTGTISNSGSIVTYGTAGVTLAQGLLTNTATGFIRGRTGVVIDAATVLNSGTISGYYGSGVGLRMTGASSVTNYAGAAISANGTGIEIAGGTVTNAGTIRGDVGILATGTMANTLVNSGTIIGNAGTAVQLGGGNDLVQVLSTSVFTGLVDGGAGTNTLQFASGTHSTGNYTSFANLIVNAAVTGTNVSSRTLTTATTAGTLINSGTITNASGVAVTMTAGSLSNGGLVSGLTAGISVTSGSAQITNTGTIRGNGTAGIGIVFSGTASGTIDNFGTISGAGGTAIQFAGGTNSLILEAGSLLQGAADGSLGTNTLIVKDSAQLNSVNAIGFQYVGFVNATETIDNTSTITNATVVSGSLTNNGTLNGAVNVLSGATLTSSGAISISASSTNAGTLQNLGTLINNATILNSGNLQNFTTLTNAGTITSSGTLYNTGTLFTASGLMQSSGVVLNDGSIDGIVRLTGSGAVANNLAGARITGTTFGVYSAVTGAGSSVTVTNSGTISASSTLGTAVSLAGTATITNSGTASLISGGLVGAYVGGLATITNDGAINGTAGYGLALGSGGTVSNSGNISGGLTGLSVLGGTVQITNTGTIVGTGTAGVGILFSGSASGTIDNFGTISGAGGTAVKFAGGTNRLIMQGGSRLIGTADGSLGTNTLVVKDNAQLSGVTAIGFQYIGFIDATEVIDSTSTITNAKVIAGRLTNQGTLNGRVVVDSGATLVSSGVISMGTASTNSGILDNSGLLTNLSALTNTGTLINSSTLDTTGGMFLSSGLVTNSGSITGTVTLTASGAVVDNLAGAVISGGTLGVVSTITGTGISMAVNNAGTILGSTTRASGVAFASAGTVNNSGSTSLISGAIAGVYIGGLGTILNFGSIAGLVRFGASLGTGGSIVNGGRISGVVAGVSAQGGTTRLTNTGTIAGTGTAANGIQLTGSASGTIDNSGTSSLISGTQTGISLNSGGTILNAGTISGTSTDGVSLAAGGSISNSGQISGGQSGVYVSGGTALITNTGTIAGTGTAGIGVHVLSGSVTVDNYGMISGAGGTAVSFEGGTNRLILRAGSTLTGTADGRSGTNTLIVRDSANLNTVNAIGFRYVGFMDATRAIDSSSTVSNALVISGTLNNQGTLNGSLGVDTGATLTNNGNISVDTSSTNNGVITNTGTFQVNNTLVNAGSLSTDTQLGNTGFIDNRGAITGNGSIANSGSFNNTGSVRNQTVGVTGSGTISNSGTIEGIDDTGVILSGSGELTNSSSGVIKGGRFGMQVTGAGKVTNAGTIIDDHVAGISLASGATLANSGVLDGAVGLLFTGSGASASNSGTITGTGGVAVQFGSGANSLTLSGGSVLNGNIDGGGSASSLLLSGAGTMSNTISNFGTGSSLTVGSGASWTASGNWTVGSVTNSGTLQPGAAGSMLTINGNFTQQAGGTLQIAVNPAGQSSQLKVSGAITINGGTLSILAANGTYQPATSYSFLTGGSLTGTFGSVTTDLAFLTPALNYTSTGLTVSFTGEAKSLVSAARTRNQRNVAIALEAGGSGSDLYKSVIGQSTDGAVAAFDALSGEAYASARSALFDEGRMISNTLFSRLRKADQGSAGNGSSGVSRYAATSGITIWSEYLGADNRYDENGNAASAKNDRSGFLIGGDGQIDEDWRVGFAGGYSSSNLSVPDRASWADINLYSLGIYAGRSIGPVNVRFGGAYSWGDIDMARRVTYPGVSSNLTSSYDARMMQVFGEVGYTLQFDDIALEPFANLSHISLKTSGTQEKGGFGALSIDGSHSSMTYSTLGLRTSAAWTLEDGSKLSPNVMLGWQHAFGSVDPSSQVAFSATGSRFEIFGAPMARDAALLEVGLDWTLADRFSLGVSYRATLTRDEADNAFAAKLQWRF